MSVNAWQADDREEMSEDENKSVRPLRLLISGLRFPRAFLLGGREFRRDLTTSFDDWAKLEAYDSGRELAHRVTRRRWDQAF